MPYVISAERFGIEAGKKEGLQQGLATERQLLARQIRLRYGQSVAQKTQVLLSQISDTDRLTEVGEWIIEEENGDVFLERLQKGD